MEFKDLEFKKKISQGMFDYRAYSCLQAIAEFENGYSLSILKADETGPNKYCQANENSYEIAILKNGNLYYSYSDKDRVGDNIDEDELDQDSFEGVWIYQSEQKVNELLEVISKFPKDE